MKIRARSLRSAKKKKPEAFKVWAILSLRKNELHWVCVEKSRDLAARHHGHDPSEERLVRATLTLDRSRT